MRFVPNFTIVALEMWA